MGNKNFLLVFVLQIVLTYSLSASTSKLFTRQKILNKTAFQQVTKNTQSKLLSNLASKFKIKGNSVFQRLQSQYSKYQQIFYSEAKTVSASVETGLGGVMDACDKCKGTALGRDRTQCYASCITRELNAFVPYALLIGDTVQNFFCIPLGFGFETLYSTRSPVWVSFKEFVKLFNSHRGDFSESSLVETWLSNLLWLDSSPLYLHSYIRSQVAVDIANLQNGSATAPERRETSTETPAMFAEKCGSQWDLREPVYSLINAAKQKSHYLGIVLRGLFTFKSAAFYTRGAYGNLAAGIVEALGAIIGKKCDIISYSDGEEVSDNSCDGMGRSPIPQFPVPLMFLKLLLPCEEEKLTTNLG